MGSLGPDIAVKLSAVDTFADFAFHDDEHAGGMKSLHKYS